MQYRMARVEDGWKTRKQRYYQRLIMALGRMVATV